MRSSIQEEAGRVKHPSVVKGVVIGVLIAALVLIFGAFYLWGSMLGDETAEAPVIPPNREPETPRADADVQILNTVSSSDELSAIEADLESTNLETLDAELSQIESELAN
jgi:hypothetical protein